MIHIYLLTKLSSFAVVHILKKLVEFEGIPNFKVLRHCVFLVTTSV